MGLLAKRFLQAHPPACGRTRHDGRSPSSGLDAESTWTRPSEMQPLSRVKTGNIFQYSNLFSATHFDGFEKLHLPFIFRLFVRFERFTPLFRPLRTVESRQVIDDLRSA